MIIYHCYQSSMASSKLWANFNQLESTAPRAQLRLPFPVAVRTETLGPAAQFTIIEIDEMEMEKKLKHVELIRLLPFSSPTNGHRFSDELESPYLYCSMTISTRRNWVQYVTVIFHISFGRSCTTTHTHTHTCRNMLIDSVPYRCHWLQFCPMNFPDPCRVVGPCLVSILFTPLLRFTARQKNT